MINSPEFSSTSQTEGKRTSVFLVLLCREQTSLWSYCKQTWRSLSCHSTDSTESGGPRPPCSYKVPNLGGFGAAVVQFRSFCMKWQSLIWLKSVKRTQRGTRETGPSGHKMTTETSEWRQTDNEDEKMSDRTSVCGSYSHRRETGIFNMSVPRGPCLAKLYSSVVPLWWKDLLFPPLHAQ